MFRLIEKLFYFIFMNRLIEKLQFKKSVTFIMLHQKKF